MAEKRGRGVTKVLNLEADQKRNKRSGGKDILDHAKNWQINPAAQNDDLNEDKVTNLEQNNELLL